MSCWCHLAQELIWRYISCACLLVGAWFSLNIPRRPRHRNSPAVRHEYAPGQQKWAGRKGAAYLGLGYYSTKRLAYQGINSMFRWYQNAEIFFGFLSEMPVGGYPS